MHSENMFTSDYVRGGGAKCNTVGCVNQNKTTIRNDSVIVYHILKKRVNVIFTKATKLIKQRY